MPPAVSPRTMFLQYSRNVPYKTLIDPDSFATTLFVLLFDRYGSEMFEWAPETLRLEIADDFGVRIPQLNFDKVLAVITILSTDYFFKDLSRFIQLTNALCGDGFDFETFDKADVDECAWAITEVMLINPPDEDEPFDDEIRHYLTYAMRAEGFMIPPDILRIAFQGDGRQRFLNEYADDPDTLNTVFSTQQAKTDAIDEMVRENVLELFQQLSHLPLQNGNSSELMERLRAGKSR